MSNHNISLFNEKLRVMNQSNSKQLVLSAAEARALQSEIFALLGRMEELNTKLSNKTVQEDLICGEMDGGRWD